MFALPLFAVNGVAPFCARIMALWSRAVRGGREDEDLRGRARVGVAVAFAGEVVVMGLLLLLLSLLFLEVRVPCSPPTIRALILTNQWAGLVSGILGRRQRHLDFFTHHETFKIQRSR
jgi:hypothetical protein